LRNILQPDVNNFSPAQAQPGQEHQNRIIAPSRRRRFIAMREHLLRRCPGKILRQAGQFPVRHTRHGRPKIRLDVSAITRESQERAQSGDYAQGMPSAMPMGLALHKCRPVPNIKLRQTQAASSEALR